MKVLPTLFKDLAAIYAVISALPDAKGFGDLYIDDGSEIKVGHMDNFTVGRFILDGDFWVFEFEFQD